MSGEPPPAGLGALADAGVAGSQFVTCAVRSRYLAGKVKCIPAVRTADVRVPVIVKVFALCLETLYDVGVAGIHRLLARRELIMSASCIIVVAGMEGALPSVVGGLVDIPVIACPTSVGYGASLHGFAALFGMLTSCASGVTVVNIDNGFGAGYAASLINRVRPAVDKN